MERTAGREGLTEIPWGTTAPQRRRRTQHLQRSRLEKAMVEVVSRRGYGETTVAELVRLAGVSKTTFYNHFDSKEECFLATLDTIVDDMTARVEIAYSAESGSEERVAAGFAKFLEIINNETAAVSLVVVDALSLGATALPHLEQAEVRFERMLRRSFAPDPAAATPTELQLAAIVAGLRTVVYRCLRSGRPQELAEHGENLREWALCYGQEPGTEQVDSTPPSDRQEPPAPDPNEVSWNEPADSAKSRAELTQRERIIRATAQVAARVGFAHLTIPAISATAGTSNQTFYEHFDSKEEAFLTSFQEVAGRALRASYGAAVGMTEWKPAVETGLRAFLEYVASEPLFARLAFFELPAAGAASLDHAEPSLWRFAAFLDPEALPDDLNPVPDVVAEAIGGGMWAVMQHEIAAGRPSTLPGLADQIIDIAMIPLRRQSAWPQPSPSTG